MKERLAKIEYRKERFAYKCSNCGEKQSLVTEKDLNWLIEQAKTLAWVKEAIKTCNEQDLTPKELAKLLEQ